MGFDDVPLEDAGRDYYARQFGDRVRNIRKYGAPPSSRNSAGRGSAWMVAAVVFTVLVVIRVLSTVLSAGDSSSSNYDDAIQTEPHPWQMQQPAPPDFQPDARWRRQAPIIIDPDRLPPPHAPDELGRPNKDD